MQRTVPNQHSRVARIDTIPMNGAMGSHEGLRALHQRMPGLRKLPFPALGIVCVLLLVNAATWAATGVLLVSLHQSLDSMSRQAKDDNIHARPSIPLSCIC